MHLSKESATESCVISFRITLLLRLPFIFESMRQGALGAAVALLVEGTGDENYFSIVSRCTPEVASLHALQRCGDEDCKLLASNWFNVFLSFSSYHLLIYDRHAVLFLYASVLILIIKTLHYCSFVENIVTCPH